MAAVWPAPALVPGWLAPQRRAMDRALSVLTGGICVVTIGLLAPPAVVTVREGTAVPRAATAPSITVEGTVRTPDGPGSSTVSALVVRNTGPVPVRWRVRTDIVASGAVVVVTPRAPAAADCTTGAVRAADETQAWSEPLPPGAATTLCVTVTAPDRWTGGGMPRVQVDAHAA